MTAVNTLCARLPGADFEHDHTRRRQDGADDSRQSAIGIQPVRAAVQRRRRIVPRHIRRKAGDIAGRNIRWVGQDDIERPVHTFRPVRLHKDRPGGQPEGGRIPPGTGHGIRIDIGPDPPGGRQFVKCRQEQTPGPRADIQHAEIGLHRGSVFQYRLDHRFAVGTRVESRRSDLEVQTAKFAFPQDARHRLVRRPADNRLHECVHRFRIQRRRRIAQHVFPAELESGGGQNSGIRRGIFDTGAA